VQRSVCVNGSIEIHVVTSTSAAHPSTADGKKLQLVLTQRSAAQPSTCVNVPLGRIHIDTSTSYRLFIRVKTRTSGAFTVTRTNTNTCNPVVVKILVKIVKYLEFLAKVYSNIAGMLFVTVYVKITSYLHYVLYK